MVERKASVLNEVQCIAGQAMQAIDNEVYGDSKRSSFRSNDQTNMILAEQTRMLCTLTTVLARIHEELHQLNSAYRWELQKKYRM